MAAKKKINKLKTQSEEYQSITTWGLITQKPSHAIVKAMAETLEISLTLIEHPDFHVFSHKNPQSIFFLIKNPKKELFNEVDVDYLFVVLKNEQFDNLDSLLFKPLKQNYIIQGAYSLSLPQKINKKILELLQSL